MSSLGFVVVELVTGTGKPLTTMTAFDWDGGELRGTVEEAKAECERAGAESSRPFEYRVAEVKLVSS